MKTEYRIKTDLDEFADSPLPFLVDGSAGVPVDMSVRSGGSSPFDDFDTFSSYTDTEEGRLSRALQSWMPDHVLKSLKPREKPPLEPVFSGRLGKERPGFKSSHVASAPAVNGRVRRSERRARTAPVRRVPSDESIATNISLLTCSSSGSRHPDGDDCIIKATTPRRRKRKVTSRASTQASGEFVSKWFELCVKSSSNRLNRILARRTDMALIGGDLNIGESEAFRMFDKDEQTALYEAALSRGVKYVDKKMKRSSSMQDMQIGSLMTTQPKLKRVLSASAKRGIGPTLDITELKREHMNRLIAAEQARLALEREKRKGRRGALARKASSSSLAGSTSGPQASATVAPSMSALSVSAQSSEDARPGSPSVRSELPPGGEERVSVWKGDREILEIDLKKDLTQRVKQRISTTRTALRRATGLGDGNQQTSAMGTHEEFPRHIEEDFCHKPKIIQRMRISPHLSDVIHDDIQVRMGRPRYHEIRVSDLVQWNKGQHLDRAHTNLKVFNWLHSLKETEFDTDIEMEVLDEIPDLEIDLELLHVESADEPDVKPLYRQYEVRML